MARPGWAGDSLCLAPELSANVAKGFALPSGRLKLDSAPRPVQSQYSSCFFRISPFQSSWHHPQRTRRRIGTDRLRRAGQLDASWQGLLEGLAQSHRDQCEALAPTSQPRKKFPATQAERRMAPPASGFPPPALIGWDRASGTGSFSSRYRCARFCRYSRSKLATECAGL